MILELKTGKHLKVGTLTLRLNVVRQRTKTAQVLGVSSRGAAVGDFLRPLNAPFRFQNGGWLPTRFLTVIIVTGFKGEKRVKFAMGKERDICTCNK